MASSSGTSSGSSAPLPGAGEAAMDERKRKRMLSNRESARRSRMRKQQHLADLKAQLSQLTQENSQILAALDLTAERYLGVEAENSVLRTRMVELSSRLQSLDDILHWLNGSLGSGHGHQLADGLRSPWNSMHINQPIAASPRMLQYY